MKLALSLIALASGVSAFAPSSGRGFVGPHSVLCMSEEEAPAEEVEEVAPPAPAAAVASTTSKVPCFGASPFLGGKSFFVGETEWDLLTTKWGSAETGTYLRAAELKHCRSAMIATVGYAFHKLGLTLNNISPHEYLSVTQGIKFADLAAMNPIDAMKSLPAESWGQMFAAIALVEIYELTHKNGKVAYDETVAPGLQAGGLTGDLGWNPLGINVTDRRRLAELQNGRGKHIVVSVIATGWCLWLVLVAESSFQRAFGYIFC
jgi:Chlorophyll A-B binding protein